MRTPKRNNVRPLVVCCERGTILDSEPFLGSGANWKGDIKLTRKATRGIKEINSVDNSYFYVTVNEPGIAIADRDYESLTPDRVNEVNRHIERMLNAGMARIEGFLVNNYISGDKASELRDKGLFLNNELVPDKRNDVALNFGVINDVLRSAGFYMTEEVPFLYVIGTDPSYIEAGLRAEGSGILIGDEDKLRENVAKLRETYGRDVYLAERFLDAGRHVKTEVARLREAEDSRELVDELNPVLSKGN